MQVTVTGGTGNAPAVLQFDANGLALMEAQALANIIDNQYTNALYYDPNHWNHGMDTNQYVIVGQDVANNVINAQGAAVIVDENNGVSSTIKGGHDAAGQIVLAGDGGLTFFADSGPETIVAGGGNNDIRVAHDMDNVAIYIADGTNTIFGGGGNTTISAGIGDNKIVLGSGNSLVDVTGTDTIHLGAGNDTIDVTGNGDALVRGAVSVAGSGYSLTFIGGSGSSTVDGGAGSYNISGGAGGGVFTGGTGGDNYIVGGTGSVSIFGGGDGDTLEGGAGNDFIKAALGNETLGGGGGDNIFNLAVHYSLNGEGAGTTDTIVDFNANDLLELGGKVADQYALATFHVDGGNGVFHLLDGTKVVLDGFTNLTQSDFKN